MNTKSDLYKMATKIILITFLNTNWINSSLKGTYSSTLDLFWTWKTKTLTRAKKELILKKMSPAWIMMSATVILLRTGASSKMGPKTFWSWIYISYNLTRFSTKLSYALKSKLFCSGKQCLYFTLKKPLISNFNGSSTRQCTMRPRCLWWTRFWRAWWNILHSKT